MANQLIFKNLLTLTAVFALTVQADEGVLEINQTCAVNGGCFSGDSAGFPVTITNSGSYRLTSDLEPPADTNVIELDASASGSTIDLNGLAIRGPETCDGTPVTSCTGTTTTSGISGPDDVAVHNGVVRGMSSDGITLNDRAQVIGVRVSENGGTGISLSTDGTVKDSVASRNGTDGVFLNGTVINVRATGNGDDGIELAAALARDSVASDNGDSGIEFLAGASMVIDSVVISNEGDGIDCDSGGPVKGNLSQLNTGMALNSCTEIGTNFCDGNTTCP